jgi:hypothetical protein
MLALAATGFACGATNTVNAGQVHVSGTLSDADVPVFLALLDSAPTPTTVVFDKCKGGTLSAATKYANAIRQRQLRTVARHQVSSGCALAFLGGVKRSFDDGVGVTTIGLHVARRADGSGPSAELLNMRLLTFMDDLTGRKLGEPVLRMLAKSWTEASGVYFVSVNLFLFRQDRAMYCDGTEAGDSAKCLRLDGIDAFSQGIVTER